MEFLDWKVFNLKGVFSGEIIVIWENRNGVVYLLNYILGFFVFLLDRGLVIMVIKFLVVVFKIV